MSLTQHKLLPKVESSSLDGQPVVSTTSGPSRLFKRTLATSVYIPLTETVEPTPQNKGGRTREKNRDPKTVRSNGPRTEIDDNNDYWTTKTSDSKEKKDEKKKKTRRGK